MRKGQRTLINNPEAVWIICNFNVSPTFDIFTKLSNNKQPRESR